VSPVGSTPKERATQRWHRQRACAQCAALVRVCPAGTWPKVKTNESRGLKHAEESVPPVGAWAKPKASRSGKFCERSERQLSAPIIKLTRVKR